MLILECVEQKKECRGPKLGGLLPISSLGSRHYSGVATGGTMTCTAGVPALITEDSHVRASVPGKACCDRPPWVLCQDREFPVATKMACPVSGQGVGQLGLSVSRQARATEEFCHDRLYNVFCHYREVFVAIDFSRTLVAIEPA